MPVVRQRRRPDSHVGPAHHAASDYHYPGGQQGDELTVEFTVLLELTSGGGERAKRAFEAMMTMRKIDIAALDRAVEVVPADP